MGSEAFIQQDLFTILDFIRWAASRFNTAELEFGHGTDNAIDEANHLVVRALNLPHQMPEQFYHARLTHSEKRSIVDLVDKRIHDRTPLPYLLNEAWFGGMQFYVDHRVLIPRSPIGELIGEGFRPWASAENIHQVLDLCTGSGCIAIACALAFPEAQVDAADISTDALEVAHINVERYQLGEQVKLHASDLFDGLPAGKRYDLIVSNPPYVDAGEMAILAPEYQHEPQLGLAAGEDGLDLVRRILLQAADYLTEHGVLVVEVGASQYALLDSFPQVPFTWVDFQRGGDGVFILTAGQLEEYRGHFALPAQA